MRPRLHLIFGPTTTGKTGRSVELAKDTGAAVISIDRIQCHPELSIGSGRPLIRELESTRRVYLCDRPVVDGELPPEQANELLHELVSRIGLNESLVILEGGSISLLRAIASDPQWNEYEWIYERRRLPARGVFHGRASARIREMLASSTNGSILDEISELWTDERSHSVLMGIVGYRTIIEYAGKRGISVVKLAISMTSSDADCLVDEIASAFLKYAEQQERGFPAFPAAGSGSIF